MWCDSFCGFRHIFGLPSRATIHGSSLCGGPLLSAEGCRRPAEMVGSRRCCSGSFCVLFLCCVCLSWVHHASAASCIYKEAPFYTLDASRNYSFEQSGVRCDIFPRWPSGRISRSEFISVELARGTFCDVHRSETEVLIASDANSHARALCRFSFRGIQCCVGSYKPRRFFKAEYHKRIQFDHSFAAL